ncbi:hypothetical protein ACFSKU_07560 [Pontibacter silvestris]|uniref:Outer membrane protein beta-barrel domain-containing protein n=1 Tax=Pontibacter silvestris TaxID=2305183 RepID=A0ABW4WVJ2_9BACT|nr:hypothetical protein [Pontibacter silvestris]MCC9136647.1 hypothetical protein [Pontibacter silvestris]
MKEQRELKTGAPYKLAVGGRGFNPVGEFDLGLAAKYFISGSSALELGLSKVILDKQAYQLSLMYERHSSVFKSRNLLLYYGVGGGMLILNQYSSTLIGKMQEDGDINLRGGIGYIAGVELGIGKIPLALSFDFRGIYYIGVNSYRDDGSVLNVASPALGLKYRFGMRN